LQESQQVLEDLYARSVSNEALSLVTNDKARPYRSRRFERLLMYEFAAFNYLAQRRSDAALVEFRKAGLVIDEFKRQDGDKNKYNDNGLLHFVEAMAYANENKQSDAEIALYHAVDAYNRGPLSLPDLVAQEAYATLTYADRQADVTQLGLTGVGEAVEDPRPIYGSGSEIVLVGFAGKGPVLKETVLWATYVVDGFLFGHYHNAKGEKVNFKFPAPPLPDVQKEKKEGKAGKEKVKSGSTFHIKFAIPSPAPRESRTDKFVLQVGDEEVGSRQMCNNDVLLKTHIDDTRMRTIARTAVRVLVRTIAAQKAKKQMRTKSPVANLLVNVGTDALSSQLERADTRMSIFLPKTIHVARVPVEPGTHQVNVAALGKGGTVVTTRQYQDVQVAAGEKRFVFMASLN
jgi:hypothetical protein